MSEKTISTFDELKEYLKSHVSEKRFIHSVGVAQTADFILKHYNLKAADESFKSFDAPSFCGIAHDIAREMTDNQIFKFCEEHNLQLDKDERQAAVLAHGLVSAEVARNLCGSYPDSWYHAIAVHTSGDGNMDSLALALFCADYLEPSRVYLSDEKRKEYLDCASLELCAYRILCDMIKHWKEKGFHDASEKSLAMKSHLGEVLTERGFI